MFVPKVDPTPGGMDLKKYDDESLPLSVWAGHQRTDVPILRHAQDERSVQYSIAHIRFPFNCLTSTSHIESMIGAESDLMGKQRRTKTAFHLM